jgi:Cytochrome c554 and c-prime
MTSQLTRTTRSVAVLVIACALHVARISLGQAPGNRATVEDGPTKANQYVFDALSCRGCHGDPGQQNELCRMTEYHTWANRDPHRIALDWGQKGDKKSQSKSAERAWEIGSHLGIDDVTECSKCIGCHSVLVPKGTGKQTSFRPKNEGVTCVACHGVYQEWVLQHQLTGEGDWTHIKTRREKWEKFGMVDLWNPVTRARVCMSCHIGDPDPKAGKMITHAMYAAGHPPLPSIEVAAFSDEQPQHWLYLRCKGEKAKARLEFNAERLEQTEQVVVSGLMALRRTMELFEADGKNSGANPTGPEFARFDCSACHHELKAPGGQPRPQAHRGGIGRPSAPLWSRALVDLATDAADPAKLDARTAELDALLAKFDTALTERPFGDRAETAKAAHAVIEWTEKPLLELSRLASVKKGEKHRVIDQTEAFRLLKRLVEKPSQNVMDYESARQVGWAFRTIDHELRELASARPSGNKDLEILDKNQPRIQDLLKGLDTDLVLSLRDRGGVALGACPPANQLMLSPTAPDQKLIIGTLLEDRLKKLAGYNSEAFRQRFVELKQLTQAP